MLERHREQAKAYNNCIFYYCDKDFIIQTGDPTATGKGGTSIYGMMYGEQAKYFQARPGRSS